jgi:rhamnosyltransferase
MSNQHFKVLVLLATFNGERWISEQINSVLNQSSEKIKVDIFISDDGSTDDTLNIINNFSSCNNSIKIIDFKSSSNGAANNFYNLITHSSLLNYDYICFCDQDDIWFNGRVSRAIDCISSSGASAYSSSVIAFWDNGRTRLLSQSHKIRSSDFLFEGAGQGCTFVISSNYFSLISNFIISNRNLISSFHYHDWLIYILVRVYGGRWHFDSEPSLFYRQHASNDTGARGSIKAIRSRFNLIVRGWYCAQISLAFNIAITASSNILNLEKFYNIFFQKKSFSRKLQFAIYVFFHGRRKLIDRIVVIISIFCGWI